MIKIEWTEKAVRSLNAYIDYIRKNSPDAAIKVKREILLTTKKLPENPNIYQLDEYYPGNSGNIRRFFRWNYRFVYMVEKKRIVILNIYHTRKKPENF